MQKEIISAIRKELERQADEWTKSSTPHYFKEPVAAIGVKTYVVNTIARKYFMQIKALSKAEIFSLCEELQKSDYIEEAGIAYDWAYRLHLRYEPADFAVFEDWVTRYVNNWAKCDTLCNHAVGSFIEQYPQYTANLKQWARAENRWLRRAAAVTLVLPARKGKFLEDILEIADILLPDTDDLVQKGYGWMLKEASKQHLTEVHDYVMQHKKVMPRTALRYAIEKMPPDLKKRAMARD